MTRPFDVIGTCSLT
jgi:hypothetical protein